MTKAFDQAEVRGLLATISELCGARYDRPLTASVGIAGHIKSLTDRLGVLQQRAVAAADSPLLARLHAQDALQSSVRDILAQKRPVHAPTGVYVAISTLISALVQCGHDVGDVESTFRDVLRDRNSPANSGMTLEQQLDKLEEEWPGFRSFVGIYTGRGPNGIPGVIFRQRISVVFPHGPAVYEDLYDEGKFRFTCWDGNNRQFPDLLSAVEFVEQYTGRVL